MARSLRRAGRTGDQAGAATVWIRRSQGRNRTASTLRKGVCFRLRGGVLKQKAVRNVVAPFGGKVLLPQTGGPAKPGEDRPDQVIFGLALVLRFRCRELGENSAKIGGQGVDFGVGQKLPVGNARDRFLKEVGGKQAPLRDVLGCHALVVPLPCRRRGYLRGGWRDAA